jgi:hypothetical protein
MAAPTNAARVKKALANSEPSTHGPTRTSRYVRLKSEMRCKADIRPRFRAVDNAPQIQPSGRWIALSNFEPGSMESCSFFGGSNVWIMCST